MTTQTLSPLDQLLIAVREYETAKATHKTLVELSSQTNWYANRNRLENAQVDVLIKAVQLRRFLDGEK